MAKTSVSKRSGGRLQGNSASEIYRVQPYYRRFNQKYNLTRQQLWEPHNVELVVQRSANLGKLIRGNHDGYHLEDWAFYLGAQGNMTNSGFSINAPNRRGNSWTSLARRAEPTATLHPFVDYGKMEPDPVKASRLLNKMARFFGAADVGFCNLDRNWVYSDWFDEETKRDYPIKFSDEPGFEKYSEPVQLENKTQVIPKEMRYAVVMIHEMDEAGIATAPTLTQNATVLTVYSRISFINVMVAEFIRGLGYNAIPCSNDTAISIPMAVDAGLGELGRNAKLIHPVFGPRCRISKVLTDLPVVLDRPQLWGVTEFCNNCGKCADHCPAKAIPTGDRSFEPTGDFSHRGVLQWQVDHGKCYEYWVKVGTNCGTCIRTCPFNKPHHWAHNIPRWMVRRNSGALDRLMRSMDDRLGYGGHKTAKDFWNG